MRALTYHGTRDVRVETVPDPVFAQCMMGDGVAVHPLADTVCAPFDGEVVNFTDPPSGVGSA